MRRQIEVTSDEPALVVDEDSVRKCITLLDQLNEYRIPGGSMGIAFVNRETCSDLHRRFFDDPEVTDVMTFPGQPEDGHAGDIAICPFVAKDRIESEGTTFEEELALYLVHACLHLAGLDDKDPDSIKQMRKGESVLINHLKDNSSMIQANWIEP